MNNPIDPISGLTMYEEAIMNHLIAAWNIWVHDFAPREQASEEEKMRFRDGMHQMQGVLADRALARAYPEYWRKP